MDAQATRVTVIRDAIYSRIVGVSGMFQTVRRTPVPPLNAVDLPACSIFFLTEDQLPDGDANIGMLKYINEATIGISVVRAFDDPVLLEGKLDLDVDFIKHLLFTDASFTNRSHNKGMFEAIPRIRRNWVFSTEGEGTFAELRLELTFRFREQFEPFIPDRFRELAVQTKEPRGTPDVAALIELPQHKEHEDDTGSPR